MSRLNSEIKYPISPTVLIGYIKSTSVYPVYIGSNFISFSIEPFLGGKILPPNVSVYYDKILMKNEVEDILEHLNLRIDAFEDYLVDSL